MEIMKKRPVDVRRRSDWVPKKPGLIGTTPTVPSEQSSNDIHAVYRLTGSRVFACPEARIREVELVKQEKLERELWLTRVHQLTRKAA